MPELLLYVCGSLLFATVMRLASGALSPEAMSAASLVLARAANNRPIFSLIEDDDCDSLCTIETENWTRYTMLYPSVTMVAGKLTFLPRTVVPAGKDNMMGCEYRIDYEPSGKVAGTYGTVSWEMSGLRRRVYVAWSLRDLYKSGFIRTQLSNWLSVGLSAVGQVTDPPGNGTYLLMTEGNSTNELGFERRKYDLSVNLQPFTYTNGGIQVEGFMGTGGKTEVKVVVRPVDEADLAPAILAEMRNPGSSGAFNPGSSRAAALKSSAVLSRVAGSSVIVCVLMFFCMLAF